MNMPARPKTPQGWLTWVGGLLSGIVALIMWVTPIVDSLVATDWEVAAAMKELREQSEATDADILRQLLEAVQQQNVQLEQQNDASRQQYLALKRQILTSDIERLTDKLTEVPENELWYYQERIDALNKQLDGVNTRLEAIMLNSQP